MPGPKRKPSSAPIVYLFIMMTFKAHSFGALPKVSYACMISSSAKWWVINCFRRGFRTTPSHESLYGEYRSLWVCDCLTSCHGAHRTLSFLRECHHRGRGAVSFRIGNDDGFPAFHPGNTRVGRARIYSNYFSHVEMTPFAGSRPEGVASVCVTQHRSLLVTLNLSNKDLDQTMAW